MLESIKTFLGTTGVAQLFADSNWWQYLVMYAIVGVLFYLAIVKKFEPLLLMPIAFGMLLANLPGANLIHLEFFFDDYYGEHVTMQRMIQEQQAIIQNQQATLAEYKNAVEREKGEKDQLMKLSRKQGEIMKSEREAIEKLRGGNK